MIRTPAATLSPLLLSACGSMNVVSDSANSRLMLKGYDPVAYFTDGTPVPGRPGVHEPVRAPASELRHAIPLDGEPTSFKIIDGKLLREADRQAAGLGPAQVADP